MEKDDLSTTNEGRIASGTRWDRVTKSLATKREPGAVATIGPVPALLNHAATGGEERTKTIIDAVTKVADATMTIEGFTVANTRLNTVTKNLELRN